MNTPDAPEQIRQIIEQHEGEDIQIGAGTVTHPKVLKGPWMPGLPSS